MEVSLTTAIEYPTLATFFMARKKEVREAEKGSDV